MRFVFILLLLLTVTQLFCQIDFYIETDETNYSYGQDIYITFNLHNTTTDTVIVTFPCSFPFSYYIDEEHFSPGSFPVVMDLIIPPDSTFSTNYIHFENVSFGDHILIGEFIFNWFTDPILISIESVSIDLSDLIPIDCKLSNHPNPFNPSTTIEFSIQNDSEIDISIFNTKGQKIKTIINNGFTKGDHSIIWSGNDEFGNSVKSGIYFYKLKVNEKTEAVNKCLMLK